jgi:GDPmannose 4,6-dehydratase
VQYSVRDFVNAAAKELGMEIRWEGEGVNEQGYWVNNSGSPRASGPREDGSSVSLRGGEADAASHAIVKVDPRYFRPTEVETLLGDPSNAKAKLGWTPKISFEELVAEMVREDLKSAERDELIKRHGYTPMDYHE